MIYVLFIESLWYFGVFLESFTDLYTFGIFWMIWSISGALYHMQMQNHAEATDVWRLLKNVSPMDRANILTQDRSMSYLSSGSGLRSFQRCDQKLYQFSWKQSSLSREWSKPSS